MDSANQAVEQDRRVETSRLAAEVDAAITTAAERVLSQRLPTGRWSGHLSPTAAATGPALIALHTADPHRNAGHLARGRHWLRSHQEPDGGWGDRPGSGSRLLATVTAVTALHLTDPEASQDVVRAGLAWIDRTGSWPAIREPRSSAMRICSFYLSLAGLVDEPRLPKAPVELVYLPWLLPSRLSLGLPNYLAWAASQAHRAPLRRHATTRALKMLRAMQGRGPGDNPGGGFLGSVATTCLVCIPLSQAGIGADIVERGAEFLRGAQREDGSWSFMRQVDFSVTGMVAGALQEAGYEVPETVEWIRAEQQRERLPVMRVPVGGWAWSQPGGFGDPEDTGFALKVVRDERAVALGIRFLRATQGKAGAWGIIRDARRQADAACAYFTAGVINALRTCGVEQSDRMITRALAWFAAAQRPDGTLPCAWYREHTSGTAAALETYGLLGRADDPVARKARTWLLQTQRPDGGWSDGSAQAESTVEETAWAVLGLLAAGEDHAAERGVRWLLGARGPDGLWPSAVVGTYVKDSVHYSEELFPVSYALRALARYRDRA